MFIYESDTLGLGRFYLRTRLNPTLIYNGAHALLPAHVAHISRARTPSAKLGN
ncbi:unnamed protein product [Penicillium nalgiovense]|nr:unnamed protein product [Penicillium nalgiovense]